MKDYPNSVTRKCTKIILEQMENSLYQIKNKDGKFEICFFCHIKYKNEKIPVLVTKNQVIDNRTINVSISNVKETIELGEIKYKNEEYDIMIIEIKENKNNNIFFLEIDDKLYEKESDMYFDQESIYIIHYNNEKNILVSYGIIHKIANSQIISYNSNIISNFFGFPILNLSNNKIIGIYQNKPKRYYNKGIFLYKIIKEFIKEYKYNKSIKNSLNEISIIVDVKNEDINKKIYFLGNYKHKDNKGRNIFCGKSEDLIESNTEIYINDNKYNYKKYFIPEKEGKYSIKLKFKINIIFRKY